MPSLLKDKTKDGRYRGWYKSHEIGADGRRKTIKFTGTRNRQETLALARAHQVREDRIAAGSDPAPEDRKKWRGFVATVKEYLAYGESQGGWGGRPWSKKHARLRRARLAWWHEQIGFQTLGDVMVALRPVEIVLIKLRDLDRSSKTLRHYQESLQSFCRWCVDRGYLPYHPLARMRNFDGTPRTRRRVFTLAEIKAILAVPPPERRLVYEVALFSGLRFGELRQLRGAHLDTKRGGLKLEAEWTKNRRAGFQPLPVHLIAKLACAIQFPSSPLLRIPSHSHFARLFNKDLKAAGVEKVTEEGVAGFHSWRGTYATLLDELGASPKETQELMRHSTPMLTMQRYVQARIERRRQLVQDVADHVRSALGVPEDGQQAQDDQKNV